MLPQGRERGRHHMPHKLHHGSGLAVRRPEVLLSQLGADFIALIFPHLPHGVSVFVVVRREISPLKFSPDPFSDFQSANQVSESMPVGLRNYQTADYEISVSFVSLTCPR